jgi:excinuclease UvrABC nuclease subunit
MQPVQCFAIHFEHEARVESMRRSNMNETNHIKEKCSDKIMETYSASKLQNADSMDSDALFEL